jgi:hypothetical protein
MAANSTTTVTNAPNNGPDEDEPDTYVPGPFIPSGIISNGRELDMRRIRYYQNELREASTEEEMLNRIICLLIISRYGLDVIKVED